MIAREITLVCKQPMTLCIQTDLSSKLIYFFKTEGINNILGQFSHLAFNFFESVTTHSQKKQIILSLISH